jgi:hypothetical protein
MRFGTMILSQVSPAFRTFSRTRTNSHPTRRRKRAKEFNLLRPRHLFPILKPHQPRTQPLQPRQIPPPLRSPALEPPDSFQHRSQLRIYIPSQQLPRVRQPGKTKCQSAAAVLRYWSRSSPYVCWCSVGYWYDGGV